MILSFFQTSSGTLPEIERSFWKAGKGVLFHTKLHYLGHVVSQSGIEADPRLIAAIADWLIPNTVTDVWSFLELTNYYSRFINHYT